MQDPNELSDRRLLEMALVMLDVAREEQARSNRKDKWLTGNRTIEAIRDRVSSAPKAGPIARAVTSIIHSESHPGIWTVTRNALCAAEMGLSISRATDIANNAHYAAQRDAAVPARRA